ncbi:tetratricopeptide repeat protein [Limibacter armeniacum]|uniref:tetratricopeptide repeat protein n=1 Tax=Limibacter armeniacum TaxID=466084 RepID=UPI002FE66646
MSNNKNIEIEKLFDQLQSTTDQEQIKDIESSILSLWLKTDNRLVDDLMEDGMQLMGNYQYEDALEAFSKVTHIDPDYAEGWNKRAIVYYLRGEFKLAIRDIQRTLQLEPRHFAAMSGLANIFREMLAYRKALKVLKYMTRISPNRETLEEQIKALEEKL